MRDRRRNENGRRCRESELRHVEVHVTAAVLDQEDLKQIAMTMGANGPIVHCRARGDPLDVNKVECLIVRRIAVEMKQRQCRGAVLANHGPSISRSAPRRSFIASGREDLHNGKRQFAPLEPAYNRVRDKRLSRKTTNPRFYWRSDVPKRQPPMKPPMKRVKALLAHIKGDVTAVYGQYD